MDAFELFRKLGAGAKFDLKRFGQDAARFKVHLALILTFSGEVVREQDELRGLTTSCAGVKLKATLTC